MVARRVWWRGKAVRAPPVNRRKASSRRLATCSADRRRRRAQASSKARGIPSRRQQISATAVAFVAETAKLGLATWARAQNREAASEAASSSGRAAPAGGREREGTA